MDHFGTSNNRLGTTGLNSCMGFIVILNNGEHIFVEHRSDINLPMALNLDNVRSCFQNISEHIDQVLSYENITSYNVMGEHGNKQRFKQLQRYINQLIDIDIQSNTTKDANLNKKTNSYTTVKTDEKINHYKQLFTNVICNDICFNLAPEIDIIAATTCESF